MQIDHALISRLEKLARLRLATDERETIRQDLERILTMVEKLQELDLTDVAPLTYVNDHAQRLRPDEVANQLDRAAALRNAPDHDGTYFRVPKVIDL